MNVVTAYLNGALEEEIFMEIPIQLEQVLNKIIEFKPIGVTNVTIKDRRIIETAKNWLKKLKNNPDSICLLRRSLYGLKQSGVQWYNRLKYELLRLGLNPSTHDPCLFYKYNETDTLYLTVYIDDIRQTNLLACCFKPTKLGRRS